MPSKRQPSKKSTTSRAVSKKDRSSAPKQDKKRAATTSAETTPVKKRKLDLDSRSIVLPQASAGRVLRNRVLKDSEMNADETSLLAHRTPGPVKKEAKSTGNVSSKSSVSARLEQAKRAKAHRVKDLTVVETPSHDDSAHSPASTENSHDSSGVHERRSLIVTLHFTPPAQRAAREDVRDEETTTTPPLIEGDDAGEPGEAAECSDFFSWSKADTALQASIAEQSEGPFEEDKLEQEDGSRPVQHNASKLDPTMPHVGSTMARPGVRPSADDDITSESEEVLSQIVSTVVDNFDKPRWHSLEGIKKLALSMNRLHAIIEEAGSTKTKTLRHRVEGITYAFDDMPALGYLLMAKSLTKDEKAQKERLVERIEHHMEFLGGCTKGVIGTDELCDLLKIVIA